MQQSPQSGTKARLSDVTLPSFLGSMFHSSSSKMQEMFPREVLGVHRKVPVLYDGYLMTDKSEITCAIVPK